MSKEEIGRKPRTKLVEHQGLDYSARVPQYEIRILKGIVMSQRFHLSHPDNL